MPPRVCLIVPCFNEAARLDFVQLDAAPPGVTFVLVDDGSTDGTGSLVRGHVSDRVALLQLPRNQGKGEAVRQGMLHAQRSGLLDGAEWVGYWDADMATPLSELEGFLAYAALAGDDVDGVLGSRVNRLGSTIVRSYPRHLLGRVFATAASVLLHLHCYDSQCGAKIFRAGLLEEAFAEPFLSRWAFDLEIIERLRGRRLIEYPLRRWTDVPGSTLSAIKVAGPVLVDLLRIRRRYGA